MEEELSLIDSAKGYLHAFLTKFGEFLPFAMTMQGDEIIPLEHEENEQSSTPTYLIDLYECYFKKERKDNKEFQLGLLCVDILSHSPEHDCKRSGIEYRIFGSDYIKRVIQYYKIQQDNTVLFEEMVGWDNV